MKVFKNNKQEQTTMTVFVFENMSNQTVLKALVSTVPQNGAYTFAIVSEGDNFQVLLVKEVTETGEILSRFVNVTGIIASKMWCVLME